MDEANSLTLTSDTDTAEAKGSSGAAHGSADPLVICSQCGKHITKGDVFIFGDADIGKPFFCSIKCANEYKPDVLTQAMMASIFGRWRRTSQPNEKLSDSHP